MGRCRYFASVSVFVFLVGFYKSRFGIRYRFLKISDICSVFRLTDPPLVEDRFIRNPHAVVGHLCPSSVLVTVLCTFLFLDLLSWGHNKQFYAPPLQTASSNSVCAYSNYRCLAKPLRRIRYLDKPRWVGVALCLPHVM